MNKGLVFYYLFIFLGAAFAVVAGLYVANRNGLHKKAAAIFVFSGLITGMLGAMLMARIQALVMNLAGFDFTASNLRIFGGLLFIPIFLIFPVKYLAGDYDTVTDGMTPGLFGLLGFAKLGCYFNGCCFGIPFSPGVYSVHIDSEVFPVQLLEAVLCFILSVIMFFVVLKKKAPQRNSLSVGAYPLRCCKICCRISEILSRKRKNILFRCQLLADVFRYFRYCGNYMAYM